MNRLQHVRFGFLFMPEAFLIGFVLLAVLNTLLAWTTPADQGLVKMRLLSVAVYAVLGWFTWKESRLSTWVLCILMELNAISTLSSSFLALVAGGGDTGMQLANLFAGGYFTYGGIVLLLGRPRWDAPHTGSREQGD